MAQFDELDVLLPDGARARQLADVIDAEARELWRSVYSASIGLGMERADAAALADDALDSYMVRFGETADELAQ